MIEFLAGSIIIPLVLTIIIETLLAGGFLRTKHDCVIVALAQCVTNPVMNLGIILNRVYGVITPVLLLAILELGAVVVEIMIYRKYFSDKNKSKATMFAIIANMVSFLVGVILSL